MTAVRWLRVKLVLLLLMLSGQTGNTVLLIRRIILGVIIFSPYPRSRARSTEETSALLLILLLWLRSSSPLLLLLLILRLLVQWAGSGVDRPAGGEALARHGLVVVAAVRLLLVAAEFEHGG